MKKLFFVITLIGLLSSVKAQSYVTIPDANFVVYLQTNFATCMVGNQMDITCTALQTATIIDVSNLSINDLSGIQYFINLDILICSNNQLSSLPALPNSITTLDCGLNNLTSLPTLPNLLVSLACDYNQLTSLPALPNSIHTLYCNNNQLTNLPTLPNLQYVFYCNYNQLTSIPTLPSTIRQLVCSHNQLTSLPYLPPSLKSLECSHNNIMCFDPFPNTIYDDTVSVIGNPCTCLPNYIPAMTPATLAYPLCSAGNSNGCPIVQGLDSKITYLSENISQIYPNPTNGSFIIELNVKEKQYVELFDVTGSLVSTQFIENGKATIDANHLESGIYTLSIKGSGSIILKKMVIVK